jgi:lipopolysaccharide export LptBFGC system permease protein LptF
MNRNRTSQPATSGNRIEAVAQRLPHDAAATAVFALLSGCSSAPSRNILGSYFPSWMICVLVAIGLTIVVRIVLAKVGIEDELPAPIVVYLAFTLAFSFALWLLWLS